jgi:hypothetical protein
MLRSALSGDEVGDPWDHPSFISTVDALCNNQGNNSLINAPSSVPSTLYSTTLPTPCVAPSSFSKSVSICAPFHKDAL